MHDDIHPVSYTHLDVYKRQPSSRLPHKGKSLPFGEVEADTVYGILTGIGIGKRNVLECHIASLSLIHI